MNFEAGTPTSLRSLCEMIHCLNRCTTGRDQFPPSTTRARLKNRVRGYPRNGLVVNFAKYQKARYRKGIIYSNDMQFPEIL